MEKDELKIKKYLLELGFQPNLKGYHLLAYLIEKARNGEKIMSTQIKAGMASA